MRLGVMTLTHGLNYGKEDYPLNLCNLNSQEKRHKVKE